MGKPAPCHGAVHGVAGQPVRSSDLSFPEAIGDRVLGIAAGYRNHGGYGTISFIHQPALSRNPGFADRPGSLGGSGTLAGTGWFVSILGALGGTAAWSADPAIMLPSLPSPPACFFGYPVRGGSIAAGLAQPPEESRPFDGRSSGGGRPLCSCLLQLRIQRRLDGSLPAGQCMGRRRSGHHHLEHFASRPLAARQQGNPQQFPDLPFRAFGPVVPCTFGGSSCSRGGGLLCRHRRRKRPAPCLGFWILLSRTFPGDGASGAGPGLARSLTLVKRSAAIAFFAAFSLAVSVEGVFDTLLLPENGYEGKNLKSRSINHYYPLHQHFFPPEQEEMPLLDIAFWALLFAALLFQVSLGRGKSGLIRWGLVASAAFAPFLWSRSDAGTDRLRRSLSPYMTSLSNRATTAEMGPREFNTPVTINLVAEAAQPDSSLSARPGVTPAGMVSFARIPKPMGAPFGIYQLTFPGLRVEPSAGQVSGHIVLTRGYTIPVVSYWGQRTSYPLIGGDVDENQSIQFRIGKAGIQRIICEYSGHGELALDGIQATFTPSRTEPGAVEVKRFAPEFQEGPLQTGVRFSNLPAGHYRVHFNLTVSVSSAFRSFFERNPVPFRTAVSSGSFASEWFSSKLDKGNWATVKSPDYQRPMEEGVHPPWWLSIPIAGDRARQLEFVLPDTRDIFCLLNYDGPADLGLTDIVLYWETFD